MEPRNREERIEQQVAYAKGAATEALALVQNATMLVRTSTEIATKSTIMTAEALEMAAKANRFSKRLFWIFIGGLLASLASNAINLFFILGR